MEKKLGKIESVSFGLGGYQGAMLGLHVTLGNSGWGVGDSKANWDAEQIKWSEHTKWSEEDRGMWTEESNASFLCPHSSVYPAWGTISYYLFHAQRTRRSVAIVYCLFPFAFQAGDARPHDAQAFIGAGGHG